MFLDQLVVSPMADGFTWYLMHAFRYNSVAVPDRFETDFASIPFPIDIFLPRWSNYGPAAVIHDWLYWEQTVTRRQADHTFLEAMRTLRVSRLKRTILWLGVRLGGWLAWWENARLKRSGYTRLRPPGAAWPAMPDWQRFRVRSISSWKWGQHRRNMDVQQAPPTPRTP